MCAAPVSARALRFRRPHRSTDGWSGIKNGALLERAAAQFEVLFTVDRDLAHAFANAKTKPAVVILAAGATDPVKMKPHMAAGRPALAAGATGGPRPLGASHPPEACGARPVGGTFLFYETSSAPP